MEDSTDWSTEMERPWERSEERRLVEISVKEIAKGGDGPP